jgi:hypothetical protein
MESKNKMVNLDSKFRRQLEEALEAVRLSGLQDFAGIALSNVVIYIYSPTPLCPWSGLASPS